MDENQEISEVIKMDQTTFDNMIGETSSEALVRLVNMLQAAMLAEQKSFDELSEQLRHCEDTKKSVQLKEELCLSQSRLAQLCSKNMKCFGKQASTLGSEVKSEQCLGTAAESEKIPRKSLSALHREKKEREERAKTNGYSTAHQQEESRQSNDSTLRNAFQTVLGDILGEEHKLGKPDSVSPSESPQAVTKHSSVETSARKVYISRELETPEKTADDRSQLFEELRSSVPRAPVTSGEQSPLFSPNPRPLSSSVYYTPQQTPKTAKVSDRESMLSSREKIMEQVRRARMEGHQETDVQKQPRSILKKPSDRTKSGDATDSVIQETVLTTEKYEDNGIQKKMTTESRKFFDDGAETTVEKQVTVLTQQTVVTDYSPSPSPMSSLTSPSSVSSAKFNLRSPTPPHSDDQASPKHYSFEATPGTTSPLPYKSPFRNGSRSESPAGKDPSTEVVTHDTVRAEVIVPKLPDTAPPTSLPDIVDVKTKKPIIQPNPLAKPVENGHSKEAEALRKPFLVDESADQASVLPHALNRARVQVTENGDEKLVVEENVVCREWDPTPLLEHLYKIDYHAKSESKRARFVNMEGHLSHLPLGVKSAVIETAWKEHYFRTKEGRLMWYQRPYADDYPLGDVLLAGSDIDTNREESTLTIHGGRDASHLLLRCSPQLLEKWRQALLSHAASSIADCYVQPVFPPVPHPTEQTVIIELGSSSIRAGVLTAEPSLPQVFFPSISTVLPNGEVVVGIEALKPEIRHRGNFVQPIRPTQPAVNRYTMDLGMVRHLLSKVFRDLQVQPHSYKVLLSVPQNCPTQLVADLLKVLVNEFHVRGAGVMRQPCLVLYSYDVTTGVVLDIGDRMNIVPVIDGYVVQNAIVSLPYGSSQISESLREKLSEENSGLYAFVSIVEKYILRYILEQSCRVAPDYEKEVESYNQNSDSFHKTVNLDKFHPTTEMQKEFRVDSAQFTSTEGLMKPKRWGLDINGLHKLLFNSVQTSPMDSRRTLYRNIYLAGGTTLLPGLAERLENELSQLVAPSIHVQVHISPWRYHSAYIGAQVLASSIQFDQTLVTASNIDAFVRKLYASNF